MVTNGFSLFELRKLFLDELYEYHDALFYMLEQTGKIKAGSYAKIMDTRGSVSSEDTLSQLKSQLFTSMTKIKKS